jgi:hypothetical protein
MIHRAIFFPKQQRETVWKRDTTKSPQNMLFVIKLSKLRVDQRSLCHQTIFRGFFTVGHSFMYSLLEKFVPADAAHTDGCYLLAWSLWVVR